VTAVIYLARHGETDYNRERRFQGQGAVGLNDRGREQAHELAANAQGYGIVALYCSPLPRAHETAAIVGDALGLAPVPDARFMETDTGDWTDRLFDDVEREQPGAYAAYHATDPDFAFPGGESLKHQSERVVAGLEDVRQGPTPALVVAHRGVIRCVKSLGPGLQTFMSWDIPNGALEAV
jgi:broad specificity phosphatase PhoE